MNYALYGLEGTGLLYHFVNALIGVALIEEGVKYLALRIATWKNKDFNYTFDGIVYAVVSSLGFATIENILYVIDQPYGATTLAVSRALTSIPGHTAFGVFMGYYYGKSKLYSVLGDKKKSVKTMWLGMGVSILLHGFYDFCLFTGETVFVLIFYAFIILLDIFMFKRVRDSEKQDTPFYREYGMSEGSMRFGQYVPDNSDYVNVQYGAGVGQNFSQYSSQSNVQQTAPQQYGGQYAASPYTSAEYGQVQSKFAPNPSQQQYIPPQSPQPVKQTTQGAETAPYMSQQSVQGTYQNMEQFAPKAEPVKPTRYMPPKERRSVQDAGGEIRWGNPQEEATISAEPGITETTQTESMPTGPMPTGPMPTEPMPAEPMPMEPVHEETVQTMEEPQPETNANQYYDPDGFFSPGSGNN